LKEASFTLSLKRDGVCVPHPDWQLPPQKLSLPLCGETFSLKRGTVPRAGCGKAVVLWRQLRGREIFRSVLFYLGFTV